ncbi:MAG: DUF5329 family protein [Thermodesulfobacteriota bacterium]
MHQMLCGIKAKTPNQLLLLMFSLFITLPNTAGADVPASEKPEVEYLLNLVKTSPCGFERNGKMYDGGQAYGHIKKKYEHFREDITSTEGFIEYAATKSLISGKYYFIVCPGREPERTGDWLLRELGKYRESR